MTRYLVGCLLLVLASAARAELWVTWTGVEPDTCGSAWLIKRFIDPKAEFAFAERGEPTTVGTPFDTAYAQYRRYHNLSTYESLLKAFAVNDPAAVEIGRIMHDIEVNLWDRKQHPESLDVQEKMRANIAQAADDAHALELNFVVLEALYERFRTGSTGR